MKLTSPKLLLTLGLVATALLPVTAAEPDADQILRQMSARLAAARQFSFEAHRKTHGAVLPGRTVPEDARISVLVKRPNAIVAKSRSKDDVRDIYFDGRTLTLVDATKNFYATVPLRASIDGLLSQIEAKYGFTPPLGELAASDVYEDMRHKLQGIAYLGRGRIPGGFLGLGGVECERVQLRGKVVDAELWVAVSDQLPRKLIVSFKNHPGQPKLTAELSDWNLAANVSDQAFAFHPPKGAVKIPMKTTAEMKAARSHTPRKQ
jgi:hypothetical protein